MMEGSQWGHGTKGISGVRKGQRKEVSVARTDLVLGSRSQQEGFGGRKESEICH